MYVNHFKYLLHALIIIFIFNQEIYQCEECCRINGEKESKYVGDIEENMTDKQKKKERSKKQEIQYTGTTQDNII